jgi:hypothetical protein
MGIGDSTCPTTIGPARRVLRDKIAAHDSADSSLAAALHRPLVPGRTWDEAQQPGRAIPSLGPPEEVALSSSRFRKPNN